MMTLLVYLLRSSMILAAALLVVGRMRRSPAALRHRILVAAIAAAVIAPAIGLVTPALEFEAPRWLPVDLREDSSLRVAGSPVPERGDLPRVPEDFRTQPKAEPAPRPEASAASAPATLATGGSAAVDPRVPARIEWPDLTTVLIGVWLTGALLALSATILEVLRLRRISAASHPLTDARWLALAESLARETNLRRMPRLLQCARPSLLATWGIARPEILLPAGAEEWQEERVHVVLLHEFAHVRRGDWLIQMLAGIARALYWFNPLMWAAERALARESEHACDDVVLNNGVEDAAYASHLLDLARTLHGPGASTRPLMALMMARPSTLDARFRAILDPQLNRRPVRRRVLALAFIALVVVAAPIGALRISVHGTQPSPAATVANAAEETVAAALEPLTVAQPALAQAPPSILQAATPQSPPVQSTGIRIRGSVKGVPKSVLGGVVDVTLQTGNQPPGSGIFTQARTQPDGTFEFSNVSPGAYILRTLYRTGSGTPITVGDKDIADIELTVFPTRFGRITVDDGSTSVPAQAQIVVSPTAASSSPDGPPMPAMMGGGTFVIANAEEDFRLVVADLPFGYYVKSMTMGAIDLAKTNVKALKTGDPNPDEIWVVLTATPTLKERTVSGRVVGLSDLERTPRPSGGPGLASSGGPVLRRGVYMQAFFPNLAEHHRGGTELRADGTFEIKRVPPGSYEIRTGGPNGGSATIVVGDRDVTGIEVPAYSLPAVIGNPACVDGVLGIVRVDDRSVPPTVDLEINDRPEQAFIRLSCRDLNIAIFRGSLNPGRNVINVTRLPLNYHIQSMTFGNVDLTKGPVILPEYRGNTKIEVVLTRRPPASTQGARVSGRIANVELPHKAPLFLTLDSTVSGPHLGGQLEVPVDRRTGEFEIPFLPSGHYTVRTVMDTGAANREGTATFTVGGSIITSLELSFEPVPQPVRPGSSVPLNPGFTTSLNGVVEMAGGAIPEFEIGFAPTRGGAAVQTAKISGRAFSVELPAGEYRAVISGLPRDYAVASVSAGPLDLTEPFLVTYAGIADRFTGSPIVTRSQPSDSPKSVGITVRLQGK